MTHADICLIEARILTMDPANPRTEAIALCGGRILALGTNAEIRALAGPRTRILSAGGRSLLPGFVESHLHLVLGAADLDKLQLDGISGAEALRHAFHAYALRRPDMPLLLAKAAAYDILPHPVTRHDLDAIIADRPIAMVSPDLHTVWANSQALRAAGVLEGGPDLPVGHEVVMGADGLATGELREFAAFSAVLALTGQAHLHLPITTGGEPDPPPDAAQRAADKAVIAAGFAYCAAKGITSMVNMDGNRYMLDLLAEMDAESPLPVRILVPFHFKPDMDLAELDRASAMQRDFHSDRLRSGFVKMFMDGVIDSRTALVLDAYPGHPDQRGEALFSPEKFRAVCIEADRRGLQIAVHAVGDGAVRAVIDGYAAAADANGLRDLRHRIEHIELIARTDVPRMAALGITASIQPAHVPGAMDLGAATMATVIPRDRWPDAYLCRDLQAAGIALAFASDWPVADVDVMRNLRAHLARQPFEGCRDQRMTLETALHAYTAGGAWAAHLDQITGRLVPGLAADLVVLDGDIENTAPDAIDRIGIALTVADGRITHAMPGFADG